MKTVDILHSTMVLLVFVVMSIVLVFFEIISFGTMPNPEYFEIERLIKKDQLIYSAIICLCSFVLFSITYLTRIEKRPNRIRLSLIYSTSFLIIHFVILSYLSSIE